jgi:hypothetical protein
VKSIREDFEPAMNSAMLHFDSFGEAVATIGGGIRRAFTGDFRDSAQVVRDDFNKTLEETIQSLLDVGATSVEIDKVARHMRVLARAAEGDFMRELFLGAAGEIQIIADETAEIEGDLILAAKAGDGLTETFGETLTTAEDVKKGIEKWTKPIKDAKDLMEEILGLTNRQSIMYDTLIEPAEDRIALRNVAIADARNRQAEIAAAMGKSVGDIEEGENAIFDTLEDEVAAHERLNEKDSTYIDTLTTRLELEKEYGETQIANNVLADLQNGKYDKLTGELMPEQLRLLEKVVRTFLPEGGEGISNWIALTEAMGETLDEDVLEAVMLIVDGLADNKLSLSVNEAMVNLGRVEAEATRISSRAYHMRFVTEARERQRGSQHGIRNFMGGLMRVGEAGEELIRLPRGSDVIPRGNISHELRREAQQREDVSAHVEVNITTSLLKDFQELKAAAVRAVEEKLDEAGARTGLTKPRFGTWGAGQPRI